MTNVALNLPEIYAHLSTYLGPLALTRCVRVSRLWRALFTPVLWRKVIKDMNTDKGIPFDVLFDHAHFVRDLTFDTPCNFPSDHLGNAPVFSKLTHLKVVNLGRKSAQSRVVSLEAFISRSCPNLRSLEIGEARVDEGVRLDCMRHCKLQRFVLHAVVIFAEDWRHCLRSWKSSGLEELVLDIVNPFPLWSQSSLAGMDVEDLKFSIKMLTLIVPDIPAYDQVAFMKACPELVRVSWQEQPSARHTLLIEGYRSGCWPKLNRLEVDIRNDESFAELINAMSSSGLNELGSLPGSGFGRASWAAIQQSPSHLMSLETLTLAGSLKVTSAMAHDMLCSLPNLQRFSAKQLLDRDVKDPNLSSPRPWVCRRLKVLRVEILVKGDPSGHAMFLQRIKLLPCLQELRASALTPYPGLNHNLAFKLIHGLDILKDLGHRLIEIVMDTRLLAKEDFDWISTHWYKLDRASDAILDAFDEREKRMKQEGFYL